MQAIQVKYLSATNTKCSRIKAWSYSDKQAIITWDDEINDNSNFANAAMELLKKLNWKGRWVGGELPNNNFAFVCADWKAALTVEITQ